MVFNYEISADCFEIHDAAGNRHTVLSVICLGTLYHQAWWVAPGGVPKSSVCAEALLNGWFQPFGAPRIFTCDRGVHHRGRVQDLLRIHGVQLRYGALEAPYQIGRTERQGGVLKEVLKGAIEAADHWCQGHEDAHRREHDREELPSESPGIYPCSMGSWQIANRLHFNHCRRS